VIEKAFKIIQEKYQIKSKELAVQAKLTEKRISEFRTGRKTLGYKGLWKLIVALGEIKFRARIDLALFLGGVASTSGEVYWAKFLNNFSGKELNPLIEILAEEIKNKQKD